MSLCVFPGKKRALWVARFILAISFPVLSRANILLLTPSDDIQQLVDQNPEGTSFILQAGTYRLQSIHPKDGDSFVGQPGAILTGARQLTEFTREGSFWVANNQTQQGQLNGYCDAQHPRCMYPEDLFFDNTPLLHVNTLASVGPGTWHFDYAHDRIYFFDNPTGHRVETSVARSAFWGSARYVTITGLTIEKYAAQAQFGAIGDQYPGQFWTVSHNEVRWNHGNGINLATGSQAIGNYVHHNGHKGMGGNGENLLAQDNEISFNNWAGFDLGWEGGGAKFCETNSLAVRGNFIHDNNGPGVWVDVDSMNTLYENNVIVNNTGGPGITHEISYAATIRYNIVRNNGAPNWPWMWGAQILIQNSRDVAVYENTVEVAADRGNGIGIIQQNRGDGRYGPHLAANNYVHHNVITHRRSPQGVNGAVADYNEQQMIATQNNVFDFNTYYVTDLWACHWMWGGFKTWDAMRQMGQELHGTVHTQLRPAQ